MLHSKLSGLQDNPSTMYYNSIDTSWPKQDWVFEGSLGPEIDMADAQDDAHLLLKQELWVQEILQIVYQCWLEKHNLIHN